jgi:hypothetical protein
VLLPGQRRSENSRSKCLDPWFGKGGPRSVHEDLRERVLLALLLGL